MLKTRVLNRTPEYPASSLHRWQTGNRRGPRTGGKRATRVHVRRQRSRAAADRAAFTGDDLDEGRSRLTRLAQVWGRCAWGRWTLSGWTARRVGRGRCGRSRSTSPSRSCMPSRSGISPMRHTTEPAHSVEVGSVQVRRLVVGWVASAMTQSADGFRPETVVAIDAVAQALDLARGGVDPRGITAKGTRDLVTATDLAI